MPLQIGGVENAQLKYPELDYTGFTGCIRDITDSGEMYDLREPLKNVNTELGCSHANVCPACGSHGYCEPKWNSPSVCVCDVGFSGFSCTESEYRLCYVFRSDFQGIQG